MNKINVGKIFRVNN
jgi:hypothetical protein